MTTIIGRVALTILAISFALAASAVNAQYGPTAEELHAMAFSMAGPTLELRDDGLVYKKGGKKPYSGTIDKDGNEEMRYVDGVLERIVSERGSRQVRQKQVYIDGFRVMRQIEYGENNAPSSDQILIDQQPFSDLINARNSDPSSVSMPGPERLRIEESGAVITLWHANGQKSFDLSYVDGKCCIATGWHPNGQIGYEQKFVDGIGQGAPGLWDADGNSLPDPNDPVIDAQLVEMRDDLVYLGYSSAPYTGKIAGSPSPNTPVLVEYFTVDGKKHGTETQWYRKDQFKSKTEWNDGVKLSEISWAPAATQPTYEVIYPVSPEFVEKLEITDRSDPAATREELVARVMDYESHTTSWHRNGQKTGERTLIKSGNSKGALHGLAVVWFDDGQKNSESIYEHGLIRSKTMWRADGVKRCEVSRDAIDQPLQYREWDEQGNLMEAQSFAEASAVTVRKQGGRYACSVPKKQLGYKVEFAQ